MRSGIRGVLAGALTLIALQTLVQAPAAKRVGGLFQVPGQIARRFLDPSVPAIPDTRKKTGQAVGAAVFGAGAELATRFAAGRGGASSPPSSTSSYPDPFTPPQTSTPGGD